MPSCWGVCWNLSWLSPTWVWKMLKAWSMTLWGRVLFLDRIQPYWMVQAPKNRSSQLQTTDTSVQSVQSTMQLALGCRTQNFTPSLAGMFKSSTIASPWIDCHLFSLDRYSQLVTVIELLLLGPQLATMLEPFSKGMLEVLQISNQFPRYCEGSNCSACWEAANVRQQVTKTINLIALIQFFIRKKGDLQFEC